MGMVEIVLVEMEATQKIVGGLGKWALREEVSEELGHLASCSGWLFYLHMGNLLLVWTGKKVSGKWGP